MQRKRILTVLSGFILLILLSVLGYRLYEWHQLQTKRKELFVYFQSKSPVTKRIPSDAVLYLNLFDFKRVHDSLQNTKFNKVLTHWLDTGMSENQNANPLLGGMLEKTILNVIGQEFVIALIPGANQKMDLLAVARLAPGSDFLLKIALATDRKVKRMEKGEDLYYVFDTKLIQYPQIYVTFKDDFAYASNDLQRVSQSAAKESLGPDFLRALDVQAIPEDTFLFLQSKKPQIAAVGNGAAPAFYLQVETSNDENLKSRVLDSDQNASTVFSVRTNVPQILQQPSATFELHTIGELPASTMFLGFDHPGEARSYRNLLIDRSLNPAAMQAVQPLKLNGVDCQVILQEAVYVCLGGSELLIAKGEEAAKLGTPKLRPMKEQVGPIFLNLEFRREPIKDYFKKVEQDDWSNFSHASVFYFLSCLKQISGGIGKNQDDIRVEIL